MKSDRIEILTIGDELLDGRVADSNTIRFAEALATVGFEMWQRTSVPDDLDAIQREIESIATRTTKICVVSGGLWSAEDNITARAFAGLLKVELVRDEKTAEKIAQKIEDTTSNQLKQADRPAGTTLLENPIGIVPGFIANYKGCRFVVVPKVPSEFDFMVADAVIKPLVKDGLGSITKAFRVFDLSEGKVDDLLNEMKRLYPKVRIVYRDHFPEIHIFLTIDKNNSTVIEKAGEHLKNNLADHIIAIDNDGPFATSLVNLLIEKQLTVSIAESCTGGYCSNLITDVPNSSNVFLGGVVSYTNKVKMEVLNVNVATINRHGTVCKEIVTEMAQGIRQLTGSDFGLAISGLAGPTGGNETKPVGTIWLGLATKDKSTTRKITLSFDRHNNKRLAAYYGIDLLRRYLLTEKHSIAV